MRRCLAVIGLVASALANTEIRKWNSVLLTQVAATKLNPPLTSRALALMHVSQFEAVNAFDEAYFSWLEDPSFDLLPGTTAECAAASAARDIMYYLWPVNQSAWDAVLDDSLAEYTEGEANNCVDLGSSVAAAVLEQRGVDGAATANTGYIAPDSYLPGDWRPTLTAFANYLLPNWRLVTPWSSVNVLDVAGSVAPPEINSQQYLTELDEVRRLGDVNSTERTQYQTLMAVVWEAGGGTVTPPGQWFQIAQQLSVAHGLSFSEEAHLFARLGMAVADAAIVCWQTKYASTFWRPVTALTLGAYPNWRPRLTTPPFPTHTSGHSTFSAAACVVLATELGGVNQPLFYVNVTAGSLNYTSLELAAFEAAMSRLYGGIHYRSDSDDGLETGMTVGFVVSTQHLQVRAMVLNDTSSGSDNSTSSSSSDSTPTTSASSIGPSTATTVGFAASVFAIVIFIGAVYMCGGVRMFV